MRQYTGIRSVLLWPWGPGTPGMFARKLVYSKNRMWAAACRLSGEHSAFSQPVFTANGAKDAKKTNRTKYKASRRTKTAQAHELMNQGLISVLASLCALRVLCGEMG